MDYSSRKKRDFDSNNEAGGRNYQSDREWRHDKTRDHRDPGSSRYSDSQNERRPPPRQNQGWVIEGLENRTRPYDPIAAGSIDGTDRVPHDHGIVRAKSAHYDPSRDPKIEGDPWTTLFVARLNAKTTEETLRKVFSKYGPITHLRLVRDIVTGRSKRYAFISYAEKRDFEYAWKDAHHQIIDGCQILVEHERERLMKGWVPRRLGGGIGGRKESGQLRFGGRDRPFRVPLPKEEEWNPLEADGIYDSRIGVVAAVKMNPEDPVEQCVYMKQDGKRVKLTHLS